jgi:hypothetical protein
MTWKLTNGEKEIELEEDDMDLLLDALNDLRVSTFGYLTDREADHLPEAREQMRRINVLIEKMETT